MIIDRKIDYQISKKHNYMEAFRFITKISKDGIIQLPKDSTFLGQEVELIVLPKSKVEDKKIKSLL